MRYYKATAMAYELIRAKMDDANGYPNPETETETTIPPADLLPSDDAGNVYVGFAADFAFPVGDAVEEISEEAYIEAISASIP